MRRRVSGTAGPSRRLARKSQRVLATLLACGLSSGIPACTPISERGAAADGEPPASTGSATGAVDRARHRESSPKPELLDIGAPVPDFALRDQSGNAVGMSDWRGKVVVLTFFETRSPEETLCPELIDRLSELRAMLLPEWTSDVHIVGASVDPARDASDTLVAWAADRGIGGVGWTVGAMDAETLSRVATRLGVVLWQRADGSVGHTLNTIVIDRHGRFADQFPGVSGWSTADLLAAVTAVADR